MHKINDAEFPILDYIWEHEPISATDIALFAQKELGWKKNTTYTVIKRLTDRGILAKNNDSNIIVTTLVSREEVQLAETDDLINKLYKGSLKMFLVTYLKKQKMSKEQLESLQKIVDSIE